MNYFRSDIINYFKEICSQSLWLQTFIQGDRSALKRRLANAQNAKIKYPFMSLDLLNSTPTENGWKDVGIEMFIGINCTTDDYQKQEDLMMAIDVHTDYMIHFMENVFKPPKGMRIRFNSKSEDAEGYTADNIIGYFLEFTISTKINCDDWDNHFTESEVSELFTAAFTWSITGGYVTIVNTSTSSSSSKVYLKKLSDSRPTGVELSSLTFEKPSEDFFVYIESIDGDGNKKYARAYFHHNDLRTSGESYPVSVRDAEGNFISQNPNGLH